MRKIHILKFSSLGCLNDMQSNRFKGALDKGLVSPPSDAHVRGVYIRNVIATKKQPDEAPRNGTEHRSRCMF